MLLQQFEFRERLDEAIREFSRRYVGFDEAYSSYLGQYGDDAVSVHRPFLLSDTIDPVLVILGRNTVLFYTHSDRTLKGDLGAIPVEQGRIVILGRRKTPDTKLVAWSVRSESELTRYDLRIKIFPSRIHAAIFAPDAQHVLFTDLGSSAGSILVGEYGKPEPFIAMYSPPRRMKMLKIPIKDKYEKEPLQESTVE